MARVGLAVRKRRVRAAHLAAELRSHLLEQPGSLAYGIERGALSPSCKRQASIGSGSGPRGVTDYPAAGDRLRDGVWSADGG
jgi:hypothetical protein